MGEASHLGPALDANDVAEVSIDEMLEEVVAEAATIAATFENVFEEVSIGARPILASRPMPPRSGVRDVPIVEVREEVGELEVTVEQEEDEVDDSYSARDGHSQYGGPDEEEVPTPDVQAPETPARLRTPNFRLAWASRDVAHSSKFHGC